MTKDIDRVIIVGGGPVGLVSAFWLAHKGIPVHVIEKSETIPEDLRASTLHGEERAVALDAEAQELALRLPSRRLVGEVEALGERLLPRNRDAWRSAARHRHGHG